MRFPVLQEGCQAAGAINYTGIQLIQVQLRSIKVAHYLHFFGVQVQEMQVYVLRPSGACGGCVCEDNMLEIRLEVWVKKTPQKYQDIPNGICLEKNPRTVSVAWVLHQEPLLLCFFYLCDWKCLKTQFWWMGKPTLLSMHLCPSILTAHIPHSAFSQLLLHN